jgi:hypothetical protein
VATTPYKCHLPARTNATETLVPNLPNIVVSDILANLARNVAATYQQNVSATSEVVKIKAPAK